MSLEIGGYVLSKEKKIYVVGIGPGSYEGMTGAAATALEKSDVIVGYTVYIDLVKDQYKQCDRWIHCLY